MSYLEPEGTTAPSYERKLNQKEAEQVSGPWHTGYKSFLLSAELFIGTVLACAVKYMLVLWV